MQQMSPSATSLKIVVFAFVGALVFDAVVFVESNTSEKEKPSQVKCVHFVSSQASELS